MCILVRVDCVYSVIKMCGMCFLVRVACVYSVITAMYHSCSPGSSVRTVFTPVSSRVLCASADVAPIRAVPLLLQTGAVRPVRGGRREADEAHDVLQPRVLVSGGPAHGVVQDFHVRSAPDQIDIKLHKRKE